MVPSEHKKTLVDAVDRLVEPLDEILVLMRGHARAQRLVLAAITLACAIAVVTVIYALRLTSKIDAVERRLDDLARTGADASRQAASVERKIDNVEHAISSSPPPRRN